MWAQWRAMVSPLEAREDSREGQLIDHSHALYKSMQTNPKPDGRRKWNGAGHMKEPIQTNTWLETKLQTSACRWENIDVMEKVLHCIISLSYLSRENVGTEVWG